jgi:salicylate hydroxylase
VSISPEEGKVIFSNGVEITADLIIGADGIHSTIRSAIGIIPEIEVLPTSAYRCLLSVPKLREFGLEKYVPTDALEFWRGVGLGEEIVVMGPCHDGERIAVYSFFP